MKIFVFISQVLVAVRASALFDSDAQVKIIETDFIAPVEFHRMVRETPGK